MEKRRKEKLLGRRGKRMKKKIKEILKELEKRVRKQQISEGRINRKEKKGETENDKREEGLREIRLKSLVAVNIRYQHLLTCKYFSKYKYVDINERTWIWVGLMKKITKKKKKN